MPKPKFWGNFQNRAGIPLLFTALDGVGDHRALYHIPNNIIFYLDKNFQLEIEADIFCEEIIVILNPSQYKTIMLI